MSTHRSNKYEYEESLRYVYEMTMGPWATCHMGSGPPPHGNDIVIYLTVLNRYVGNHVFDFPLWCVE